jgi:hypothetical protein
MPPAPPPAAPPRAAAAAAGADDAPDMMAIGRHCAAAGCGQLDFLPFLCAFCASTFCDEHRRAGAHACPRAAEAASADVLVCPLCALAIRPRPGEAPDAAFERHASSACDPANYARVHKKPKCPVAGCRERLTTTSSFDCRACGATVCLRHRLVLDHGCAERRAAAAAAVLGLGARLGAMAPSFRALFSGGGAGGAAAGGGARSAAAAAAARRAAAAPPPSKPAPKPAAKPVAKRPEEIDLARSPSPARAAPPARGAALVERCPQCPARFATVQELIDHAGAAHACGWATPPGAAIAPRREVCVHCGRYFGDAAALATHVKRKHSGECVLS